MIPQVSQSVYVHPGDLFFGGGALEVRTVLGSCISLVIWHPAWHLGGICHFVLPSRKGPSDGNLDGRYGDEAVALLDSATRRHGSRISDYEVRIYGGGNMFPKVKMAHASSVGNQNIDMADTLARRYQMKVLERDVGEAYYRNVILDLRTGQVVMRRNAVTA